MGAKSMLISNIDSLVFDYLSRRCSSAAVKFAEEFNPSLPHLEPFTLEALYINFLQTDTRLGPTHWTDLNKPPIQEIESVNFPSPISLSSTVGIQHLPEEVKCHILNFMTRKCQFSMRNVNRTWNHSAAAHLWRNSVDFLPLELPAMTKLKGFMSTFDGKPEDGIPFSSFKIYPDRADVLRFLGKFGLQMRACSFVFDAEFTPWRTLRDLLQETPHLRKLEIIGCVRLDHSKLFESFGFSKLQSLVLSPSSNSASGAASIPLKTLSTWIILVPTLKKLRCSLQLQIKSISKFTTFLHSCRHLEMLALENVTLSLQGNGTETPSQTIHIHPSPSGPGTFKMTLCDGAAWDEKIPDFLTSLSGTLGELKFGGLKTEVNMTLPALSNLRTLVITPSYRRVHFPVPFHGDMFPILKKVTFNPYGPFEEDLNPFRSGTFPTVESLALINIFGRGGIPNDQWHLMFPNLKIVRVKGELKEGDVEYISIHFPNLLQLSLSNFYVSTTSTYTHLQTKPVYYSPLFRVQRRRDEFNQTIGWECPLSRLKKLKILECESDSYTKTAIWDLVHLTIAKVIQPLEILSITIVGHSDRSSPENLLPFSLISNANWHQKTSYNIRRKYSSLEW